MFRVFVFLLPPCLRIPYHIFHNNEIQYRHASFYNVHFIMNHKPGRMLCHDITMNSLILKCQFDLALTASMS